MMYALCSYPSSVITNILYYICVSLIILSIRLLLILSIHLCSFSIICHIILNSSMVYWYGIFYRLYVLKFNVIFKIIILVFVKMYLVLFHYCNMFALLLLTPCMICILCCHCFYSHLKLLSLLLDQFLQNYWTVWYFV